MKKIRIFYLRKFPFLVVKFSIYLNRRVFGMYLPTTQIIDPYSILPYANSEASDRQVNPLIFYKLYILIIVLPLMIDYNRSSVTFASCD